MPCTFKFTRPSSPSHPTIQSTKMLYSVDAAIVVAIIGLVFVVIFTSLRYFTRIYIVKGFGWDDFLSLLSLVCP